MFRYRSWLRPARDPDRRRLALARDGQPLYRAPRGPPRRHGEAGRTAESGVKTTTLSEQSSGRRYCPDTSGLRATLCEATRPRASETAPDPGQEGQRVKTHVPGYQSSYCEICTDQPPCRRRVGQRVVLSSAAIGMTDCLMSLVSRRRAEGKAGRRRCPGQLDRLAAAGRDCWS